MRQLILSMLFIVAIVSNSIAQGPDEQFKDCVNRFAESRGDIASYCVKIDRLIYVPKIARPDGTILFQLHRSVIEIASDVVNDRTLFLCLGGTAGLDFGRASPSVKMSLGPQFIAMTPSGFQEDARGSAFVPDPLALGGGLVGETFIQHFPLSDMIRQLYDMLDYLRLFEVKRQGPLVEFSTHDRRFVFDSSRGFLPVENESRSSQGRFKPDGQLETFESRVSGKVIPVLVKGIWLPRTVSYTTNEGFYHMELDWVAVNEPLPDFLFDKEMLQSVWVKGGQIEIPVDPPNKPQDRLRFEPQQPKSSKGAQSSMDVLDFDRAPSIQLGFLLLDGEIRKSLNITEELHAGLLKIMDDLKKHAPDVQAIRNEAIDKRLSLFEPMMKAAVEADSRVWAVIEELLPPAAQDQLTAGFLKFIGLRGLLNENIATRFKLTDEQKAKIRSAIDQVREKKRFVQPLLASGNLQEGDLPLAELNRRVESQLIRLVLNQDQTTELERMLKNCRLSFRNLATFGW